jgi:hypothetical protein
MCACMHTSIVLINRIEGVNFITAVNLGSCNVGGHTVFITHHILSSCCIDYKQYTRIIGTTYP